MDRTPRLVTVRFDGDCSAEPQRCAVCDWLVETEGRRRQTPPVRADRVRPRMDGADDRGAPAARRARHPVVLRTHGAARIDDARRSATGHGRAPAAGMGNGAPVHFEAGSSTAPPGRPDYEQLAMADDAGGRLRPARAGDLGVAPAR